MVLTVVVSLAVGQAACDERWPRLALIVEGAQVSAALEASLRTEATYEASQAGLCIVEREPVATAQIEWLEAARLSLSVTSSATPGQSIRQLSRTLELVGLPPDGIALAVASNLGELLREARRELPALRAPVPEPARSSLSIGVAAVGEAYTGGQWHGGFEAFGRFRLWERLSLEPSLGFRFALDAPSSSGTVSARFIGGGLHVIVDLLRAGLFGLGALAGARVGWLSFEARPIAPATSVTASTWVSVLRAGLELEVGQRPVRGFVRLTVGAPLRGAAATDSGARATGMTGLEGGVALGLGGAW